MAEEKQEQTPKKFNIAKKWWFWVAIAGAFTTTAFGMYLIANDGNIGPKSNNTTPTTTTYGMNEVVTVRDLEFKIISVNDTKHVGGEYVGADTEYNFAVVRMQIKNTSTAEKSIYDDNFKYFRGESEYEASSNGAYISGTGFYLIEKIGSGLSKTIDVVYEIPSAHEKTDYILAKDSYATAKIYLK